MTNKLEVYRRRLTSHRSWKVIEQELSYLRNLHSDKEGVVRSVAVMREAVESLKLTIEDDDED